MLVVLLKDDEKLDYWAHAQYSVREVVKCAGKEGGSGWREGVCREDDGILHTINQEAGTVDWANGCLADANAIEAQWHPPLQG